MLKAYIIGGIILESKQAYTVTPGRMAGGVAIALILGTLLPLIGVFQISLLMPVLMLCGIVAVYLKARSGWVPAGLLLATSLISTQTFIGTPVMLMLLLSAALPALFVMRGVARKQPFFTQLKAGIAAYGLGLVAAMLAAYAAFGGGMIAQFVDVLRSEFARMPDAALQPFADAVNSALSLSGAQGFVPFTVQTYREQLAGVLDLMQQIYARELPGTLLSGALLSGVLSVLWGNWTMARQGVATNESFIGIGRWFLPAQVTAGAVGLWLVGFIIANTGYGAGATVYATVGKLAGAAFAVQALAAVDRRLLSTGSSSSRRRVLVTLLAVMALLFRGIASLLCIVGVVSALFGSRGAVRQWLDKRQNNNSDQDDPDR